MKFTIKVSSLVNQTTNHKISFLKSCREALNDLIHNHFDHAITDPAVRISAQFEQWHDFLEGKYPSLGVLFKHGLEVIELVVIAYGYDNQSMVELGNNDLVLFQKLDKLDADVVNAELKSLMVEVGMEHHE